MEYKAYLDKKLTFDDRARDLESRMTLEEKASQTTIFSVILVWEEDAKPMGKILI
ncbi:MAG: hypothetical protein LBU32_29440 [Clostridiales bacterium]|jgi:hypothetical protein|nr:hypothetical protein [Clostridiales bacterium]